MTLNEFIDKWNGKGIDFDGQFSTQCVDLARQYWKEVIGLKSQPRGVAGAKDFWTNYESDSNLHNNFDKISNTADNYPMPYDIVIWGASYGPYGHIAVATKGDKNKFSTFSQNDPPGKLSVLKDYTSYKGVLGWLRPKTPPQPLPNEPESCLEWKKVSDYLSADFNPDRVLEQIQDRERRIKELERELESKLSIIADKESIISRLSANLLTRTDELQLSMAKVAGTEAMLVKQDKKIEKLNEANKHLSEEFAKSLEMNSMADKMNTNLRAELEKLRTDKHLPKRPAIRKVVEWLINIDDIIK